MRQPTAETLGALRAAGVPTLRTDRDGTVVVDARAGLSAQDHDIAVYLRRLGKH